MLFARATFCGPSRSHGVDGIVDTGSPVTMATPELVDLAGLTPSADRSLDIVTTGVDGAPTRMAATETERVRVGAAAGGGEAAGGGGALERERMLVFAGTCPMMSLVGWAGRPACLLGLDVLAGGGAAPARLLLDFGRGRLVVA